MMSAELTRRLGPYTGRLGWDASQLAHHQRERLRLLLTHAAGHSPFHARRLRWVDPSRLELADLARLPVMTKAEMMAQFDDVVTDRRAAEHHPPVGRDECRSAHPGGPRRYRTGILGAGDRLVRIH